MNKLCLIGRITATPEIITTQNATLVSFNLAVNRNYKNADGTTPTDFIPCVAFNKQAEFLSKYVVKGDKISVVGSIQSRKYQTQTGEQRVIIEVLAENVESLTPKQPQQQPQQQPQYNPNQYQPNYNQQNYNQPQYQNYKPQNDEPPVPRTFDISDNDLPF